jgi:hypothetical protein
MRASGHFWKFQFVYPITLALGLLCAPTSVYGQAPVADNSVIGTTDWDQWKDNCSLTTDFRKKFFNCASSTFRSRPFHFLAQSIVPGSGVGGGGSDDGPGRIRPQTLRDVHTMQSRHHSDGLQSLGSSGRL